MSLLPRRRSFLGLLVITALAFGCSSSIDATSGFGGGPDGPGPGMGAPVSGAPGAYGATPGGAQDIGYARRVIAEGGVPSAESMTVEGLLSEHDLPIDGPPCTSLLCTRPATAWAPSIETGKNERWIQLGMTSGITTFTRPPLDAVVLIDRSGSMAGDINQTNEAVARMIDKLRPDDRVAVVTYNSTVETLRPLGPVGDTSLLKTQVKAVTADGGSDMMAGLRTAFAIARSAGTDPLRMRRVMILSCGYPDPVATGPGSFVDIVEAGANDKIGFSFYGVLLGFDFRLANAMSQARGGAYSYADGLDKIEKLFDTDFDTMVTPIAYDLKFGLALPAELEVGRLYGIPGDPNGSPKTSFEVATAFISKRKGAIVARVREKAGMQAGPATGTVRLAYEPETAVKNEAPSDTTTPCGDVVQTQDATFSGTGVRKTVFLVNQLEGMKKACAAHAAGDKATAKTTIAGLLTYMKAEATVLADPALAPEVALVEKLATNLEK